VTDPDESSAPLGWPDADIEITGALVRRLLADQYPEWAGEDIEHLDGGFDNELFRLGHDRLVRLPRRAVAVSLLEHEARWLPQLAPQLSLAVPSPLFLGRPQFEFPRPWAVVPFIDGRPNDRVDLSDPRASGETLGRFVRQLHVPAPIDAPHNHFRGVDVSERASAFDERATALADAYDVSPARQAFARGLDVPKWTGPAVWVHGDLHPGNVIVREGAIVGIVDFGDICAGDPASDLACAWLVVPSSGRRHFFESYGELAPGLFERARAWAALFALMFLVLGREGREHYVRIGERTLDAFGGDGGLEVSAP
jgi:aminoglycoside phosphotransferase (APT) family kinase protein